MVVGESTMNPPDSTLTGSAGVIGPRTSGIKLSNVRFYNFRAGNTILKTCSKCDSVLLFTNGANEYFVEDITFGNISGSYL